MPLCIETNRFAAVSLAPPGENDGGGSTLVEYPQPGVVPITQLQTASRHSQLGVHRRWSPAFDSRRQNAFGMRSTLINQSERRLMLTQSKQGLCLKKNESYPNRIVAGKFIMLDVLSES